MAVLAEVEGTALGVADGSPVFAGGGEVRDLDVEEGEVALMPLGAPVGDEGGEEAAVERGAVEGAVGLALIPEDAFDGVGGERGDHAVVEGGGGPGGGGGVPGVLGQGLAGGAGGLVFALLLGLDGVEPGEGVDEVGAGAEDGHEGGVGGEAVERGPGLGGGAAPGGVDEADGDVFALAELAAVEEGDGGEAGGGGGVRGGPGGGGVFGGDVGGVVGDEQEADLREVGGGDLFVGVFDDGGVGEAAEGHLHVGLAGGDPDVADEEVGEGEGRGGGGAGDGEREGAAGLFGGEPEAPLAEAVGGGGLGLLVEGDVDGLGGGGPAPDVDGGAALEDAVVGEDVGEAEGGGGRCGGLCGAEARGGEEEEKRGEAEHEGISVEGVALRVQGNCGGGAMYTV